MEKTFRYFSKLTEKMRKDDGCNPIATYLVLSVYRKLLADTLVKSKLLTSKQVGMLGVLSQKLEAEMYGEFTRQMNESSEQGTS